MLKVKRSLILMISGAVFILSVLAWWQLQDRSYPVMDSASMFSVTQEVYKTVQHQGLLEGLKLAYFHHHWRPLFFPVVSAVLLPVVDENIRDVLKLISFIMLIVTLLIVYRYFRLFGDSIIHVFTFFILFFGSIYFSMLTKIGTEIFFITAFLGMYFIWFKDQGRIPLERRYYLFMAIWAWSCLCRPVESLAVGLPLFIYSTIQLRKERQIGWGDISGVLLLFIFAAAVALTPYLFLHHEWSSTQIPYLLCAYLAIAGVLFFIKQQNHRYLMGYLLFSVPLLVWFAPSSHDLLSWLFETSFGELAVTTGGANEKHYYDFWIDLAYTIGLSFSSFVTLAVILLTFFKCKTTELNKKFLFLCFIFLSVNIVISSLTYNWDHRYCYPNLFAMLLLSSYIISVFYKKTMKVFKFLILGFLTFITLNLAYDWYCVYHEEQYQGRLRIYLGNTWYFQTPKDDFVVSTMFSEVSKYIKEQSTNIGVLWPGMGPRSEVNGWSAQMKFFEMKKDWIANNMFEWDTQHVADDNAEIFREHRYFLIGPLDSNEQYSGGTSPGMQWFLKNCNPHECRKGHLQYIATLTIPMGTRNGEHKYYLLISHNYVSQPFPKGFR